MNIGNKIKDKREKLNITQDKLANKLKVSQSQVSRWEKNQNNPDSKEIKGLSKILGLSIEELLGMKPLKKTNFKWLKILKYIMLFLLLILIFITISFINNVNNKVVGNYEIECISNNNRYKYKVSYNKYGKLVNDKYNFLSFMNNKTDEAKYTVDCIEDYYRKKSGICVIIKK